MAWPKDPIRLAEAKRKASESKKGKSLSEDHRRKISEANKGKIHSEDSKHKMSEAQKGRKGKSPSEGTRRAIGNAHKGSKCIFWKGGISSNPDHKRALRHKYKAVKRGNGGSFTVGEWETLKKQYDNRCPICGKKEPTIRLEPDHIIPLHKGGSSNIVNIQPLCRICNVTKQTKVFRVKPNGELRLF